ncbi:MAG: flavin reductase [Flavobacteriales bacterium]|mgnify:FL=1|nr:flavin reductase [Flavobacteriales bacterium]
MMQIEPNKIITKDLHQYLLSIIGPRPIALASTIDLNGNKNVSPFSFFNIFSANPPIAIFSPARRVRNNTKKDTLSNIYDTKEVVINIVNNELVEQSSISSNEYPKEVDEFIKAGLTPIASKKIKPFRVKESPVQIECKVNDIIELGKNGGAGNLVICEVLLIHIDKNILDEDKHIDPNKIKLVGRMGGNWYSKGFGEALFQITKPSRELAIGFEKIPNEIKKNALFSKKDLSKLATINQVPSKKEVESFRKKMDNDNNSKNSQKNNFLKAKECIKNGNIEQAWKYLLIN